MAFDRVVVIVRASDMSGPRIEGRERRQEEEAGLRKSTPVDLVGHNGCGFSFTINIHDHPTVEIPHSTRFSWR